MGSQPFYPVYFIGTLLLFASVAIGMLLAPLVIGWLVRPSVRNEEKDAVYECGEPTIGSSNVQFDLRFYVVALLFIVFDVEVAFFFPWAVVFGKANTLSNANLTATQRAEVSQALLENPQAIPVDYDVARRFLHIATVDVLIFFGVVLVGFAYVWLRGDLDWVRSVAQQRSAPAPLTEDEAPAVPRPPVLTA